MAISLTVKALLKEAFETLAPVSESPRADVEILLCRVLGKSRAWLHTWPERQLEPGQERLFRRLVARRRAGEPIAYITGTRDFWSREFLVTPDVLIPRPETELLIELALAQIPPDRPWRIADLGTGSGAIAVTIALERPRCQVVAGDLSEDALSVARRNADKLGANNVAFVLSDWLDGLPPQRFHLIASNPPYIPEGDPHLTEGDLPFEPRSALASGQDGLDAIRRIAPQARDWLLPGASLLLEHGYDQGQEVRDTLSSLGYQAVVTHRDLAHHERVTAGIAPAYAAPDGGALCITDRTSLLYG